MRLFRGSLLGGRRRRVLAATLPLVGAFVLGSPATAAAATVANWEMNESSGARTMHDSSASNLDGSIGSAVVTGVVTNGATGYRWLGQNKDGHRPERLVIVRSSLLNPGNSSYAVTIRMYTGAGDQNIIQKGQANTSGGMWKIDMVEGHVICMYKGSEGRASVRSAGTLWDNTWHVVRCERRPSGVTLTVDGTSRSNAGSTGNIANSWELAIGGKSRCDPPAVQCDYYVGRLDYARIEKF